MTLDEKIDCIIINCADAGISIEKELIVMNATGSIKQAILEEIENKFAGRIYKADKTGRESITRIFSDLKELRKEMNSEPGR